MAARGIADVSKRGLPVAIVADACSGSKHITTRFDPTTAHPGRLESICAPRQKRETRLRAALPRAGLHSPVRQALARAGKRNAVALGDSKQLRHIGGHRQRRNRFQVGLHPRRRAEDQHLSRCRSHVAKGVHTDPRLANTASPCATARHWPFSRNSYSPSTT